MHGFGDGFSMTTQQPATSTQATENLKEFSMTYVAPNQPTVNRAPPALPDQPTVNRAPPAPDPTPVIGADLKSFSMVYQPVISAETVAAIEQCKKLNGAWDMDRGVCSLLNAPGFSDLFGSGGTPAPSSSGGTLVDDAAACNAKGGYWLYGSCYAIGQTGAGSGTGATEAGSSVGAVAVAGAGLLALLMVLK